MPRILVVDDDPNLRTAIRRMLEPEGFEIEEASDRGPRAAGGPTVGYW
jgi:CheY-like chemotaxis protein